MSKRLVIPVGSTNAPWQRNGVNPTWEQVRVETGCDAIEELGSPWCTANGITGLGICTERVSLVPTVNNIIAEMKRRIDHGGVQVGPNWYGCSQADMATYDVLNRKFALISGLPANQRQWLTLNGAIVTITAAGIDAVTDAALEKQRQIRQVAFAAIANPPATMADIPWPEAVPGF